MPDVLEKAATAGVQPSKLLQQKIDSLRSKHVMVALLTGLAMAVAVEIEMLGLGMFVDWWLELDWGVRLVLLLAQLGIAAFILFRMVLTPILRQPDDDELALLVEKARPQFRSRLIASLQLTRPGAIPSGASPILVDAMVEETEAVAKPVDFNAVVPTDRLKKFGAMAVMVTLLAAVALSFGGGTAMDLLKRAFLSNTPVPRKTRVVVNEGDKVIGRGTASALRLLPKGLSLGAAEWRSGFVGGGTRNFRWNKTGTTSATLAGPSRMCRIRLLT